MTSVTLIWQCPLLTVVLYIFCLPCAVHFCSYKEKFISLYCRLSSVLDLDSLITQQAFREAITDSELSTAKQRHQHIMDYIQVWSGKGNVICNFVPNYTINKKRFLFINYILHNINLYSIYFSLLSQSIWQTKRSIFKSYMFTSFKSALYWIYWWSNTIFSFFYSLFLQKVQST